MRNPLFPLSTLRAAGLGQVMLAGSLLLTGCASFATEYGTVVSSNPWLTQVAVPQQQCFDEPQAVAPRSSGAGAVAGAVIGGLIGNGIGRGTGGRGVATGIGVVSGAVIGNQIELQNQPAGTALVRRCQTVTGYESRVTAYDVVYDYQGRRYTSRMAQDPGEPGSLIALDVNVNPSGGERYPPPVASPQVGSPPATVYYNNSPPPVVAQEPPTTVYYTETVRPVYVAPPPVYYAPPAYYGGRPQYRGGTTIYFRGGDRINDRRDDGRHDRPDNRWDDRRGNRPDDRRNPSPPPSPEDIRRQRH